MEGELLRSTCTHAHTTCGVSVRASYLIWARRCKQTPGTRVAAGLHLSARRSFRLKVQGALSLSRCPTAFRKQAPLFNSARCCHAGVLG